MWSFPVVCLAVLLPLQAHAATINVPADYPTIQAAIDAASGGDTVLVAPGTYYENINFLGKEITLRSTDPEDPAVVAATIIDGDAAGTVVSFRTRERDGSVIEGFTITNGLAVNGGGIYCSEASPTIRHNVVSGNTVAGANPRGAGIHCSGGSPVIEECTISRNTTTATDTPYGGGVYLEADAVMRNCTITGNTVVSTYRTRGGGIYCRTGSSLIEGCTISGNAATASGPSAEGGGIYCKGKTTVRACAITGNTATSTDQSQGAGVWMSGTASLQDCTVADNTADGGPGGRPWGAGVLTGATGLLERCTITGNAATPAADYRPRGIGLMLLWSRSVTMVRDCAITDNAGDGVCCFQGNAILEGCTIARNAGIGVECYRNDASSPGSRLGPRLQGCEISGNAGDGIYSNHSKATIQNCTVTRNGGHGIRHIHEGAWSVGGPITVKSCTISDNGVGGSYCGLYLIEGPHTISNCIVTGNPGGGIVRHLSAATWSVSYCDVYGNAGGNYQGMSDLTGHSGNISLDPLFADAAGGDFHLMSKLGRWTPDGWVTDSTMSPCINAGPPGWDFSNEPDPNGGRVNMGAYANTAQASMSWGPPAPGPPTFAPEPTYTQGFTNSLMWSPVADAVAYYLEWATESGFTSPGGNTGWITDTATTAEGLADGQIYYYRVKAAYAEGETAWSGPIHSTQDATPPVSHVAPMPSPQPTWTFTVTWTESDATSGVAFTRLYYRFNGGPYVQLGDDFTANSVEFTASEGNGTYDFYTCARDHVGNMELPPDVPDATVVADVRPPQPDLWVSTTGADWLGDDVYNSPGAGQTVQQSAPPGATVTYTVRIQNDRSVPDWYKLLARQECPRFDVRYFDAPVGGTDITAQIATASWSTPWLDWGAWQDLRVEVTPRAELAGYTKMRIRLFARRPPTPQYQDVAVLTTVVAPVRQPDGLIRNPGDAGFIGDGIYNATATDQTTAQDVAPGVAAVYVIRVQNDGNLTDQFQITGPADGEGWTVRYYDAPTGGTDVTRFARRQGWLTKPIARGATRDFRVEVTPDSTVPVAATKEVLVRMRSFYDAGKFDVVKAVTTRN